MAHHSDEGREPLWGNSNSHPDGHQLSHRISNLSDIGDIGSNHYDPHTPTRPPLHAHPSVVSNDSHLTHGSPDLLRNEYGYSAQVYSPTPSWTGSFAQPSDGEYAPVSAPVASPPAATNLPHRALSMFRRGTVRRHYTRQSGPETTRENEEYGLALLDGAASVGGKSDNDAVPETPVVGPGFDVSSFMGPIDSHDANFIRNLQQQEARGSLTGGIGRGFRPDSEVLDSYLLSSPTVVQRNLSRSFSRRKPSLARAETIKYAGQDEANRRGEVIKVILEQPAGADISTMEGPTHITSDESRRSTMQTGKEETSQVFYPQPNWKPFPMRWPYLTLLILLSIALAAVEAILLQKYDNDNPLLKFTKPEDVKPGIYFIVKFVPTIVAVVFGVLWQFTDFEVRRLEAYYQMSKPGGALAAESINVDYVTSFNFFRPFRALKVGHYAVALSSMATTLAVSLIPTFAAASIELTPGRDERMRHPEGEKEIRISPVWSRLLISTLVLCAAGGCGLFYLLQTRRSGLMADVRGIAGLASMAVVSHILMDFKDLDTAKPKDIHHKLKEHRYLLRNSSLAPDKENPVSRQDRDKYEGNHLSANPHPLMLRPAGSIPFIIALMLFTGFIPTFLFTPADVVVDNVSWVVTALAVALKLSWNSMETAVRMMEPYYILSRRHAPSKTLTLDYTALPFGYMPLRALFNGHGVMFLVGFGTVMAEFLTILVTGLATVDGRKFLLDRKEPRHGHDAHDIDLINSGQETVMSFYLSFSVSIFILLYMFVVATIVFFRRRHPFLPRQPNTIASVLAFIHQSKMLYNFVGTTKLSNTEMARRLDDGVTTYGLGWFVGRDGQTHCGVDQEELLVNYKHGVDASQGNQPWNTRWDVL